MNDYMKTEVINMKLQVNNFIQRLHYAAFQDDEKINSEEAKKLKQINKASNKFLKDLEKTF